jgi:deazaflavin-dependent oxidoreductase (nitroreductase family)
MEVRRRPAKPAGLRRMLFRAPILLYRVGLGRLLGSRFILLHHIGRNSGRQRRTVLEVVRREGDEVTVAAGFGPGSDWYLNVLAHPGTTVQIGGRQVAATAHEPGPAERAHATVDYARRHPRAARRLARFMGFSIDGGEPDYRAMGRTLHMIRFEPAQSTGDSGCQQSDAG